MTCFLPEPSEERRENRDAMRAAAEDALDPVAEAARPASGRLFYKYQAGNKNFVPKLCLDVIFFGAENAPNWNPSQESQEMNWYFH